METSCRSSNEDPPQLAAEDGHTSSNVATAAAPQISVPGDDNIAPEPPQQTAARYDDMHKALMEMADIPCDEAPLPERVACEAIVDEEEGMTGILKNKGGWPELTDAEAPIRPSQVVNDTTTKPEMIGLSLPPETSRQLLAMPKPPIRHPSVDATALVNNQRPPNHMQGDSAIPIVAWRVSDDNETAEEQRAGVRDREDGEVIIAEFVEPSKVRKISPAGIGSIILLFLAFVFGVAACIRAYTSSHCYSEYSHYFDEDQYAIWKDNNPNDHWYDDYWYEDSYRASYTGCDFNTAKKAKFDARGIQLGSVIGFAVGTPLAFYSGKTYPYKETQANQKCNPFNLAVGSWLLYLGSLSWSIAFIIILYTDPYAFYDWGLHVSVFVLNLVAWSTMFGYERQSQKAAVQGRLQILQQHEQPIMPTQQQSRAAVQVTSEQLFLICPDSQKQELQQLISDGHEPSDLMSLVFQWVAEARIAN